MKKAFSLLVAIFTIALLSIVAGYIFYSSSTIAKVGNLQYQREQAMFLARSYTEYAIMAIEGHDRNATGNCIESIDANVSIDNNRAADPKNGIGYKVEVKIQYIGNQKYLQKCNNNVVLTKLSDTDEDTLNALIDVYVRYKDPSNPKTPLWITYHKRSLQKI